MKRVLRLLAAASVLPFLLTVFSCSDTDDSGSASEPALSYNYVTRNRGFIGGSVIYNPDGGVNNQITPGTKLGIRLGYMSKNYDTVSQLEGVDYDSTTPITIEVDKNNSQSVKEGSATINTVSKPTSDDIPTRAQYGFLDIKSVSKDQITLSATLFSSDGRSYTTVTKTIASGSGCDLNKDGFDDLKYDIPPIMRTGYADARWLTFVCSEDAGHTTMYYTFTEAEKAAGYRAAGVNPYEAAMPAEGFYGVNSDGRFIYLKKISGATNGVVTPTEGAVFGDFVLGLDDKTKVLSSELGIEDGVTATALDSAAQPAAQASKVAVNANSYTVVGSSAGNALDFANYDFVYDYNQIQFPDKEKGPKDLLDKLVATKAVTIDSTEYSIQKVVAELNGNANLPTEAEKVITLLNKILSNQNAVKTIAYSNGRKTDYDGLVADTSVVVSGQKYARRVIDTCYTQSPKADVKAPDISNIYPYAYANVGALQQAAFSTATRDAYYDTSAGREICSTYDDFKQKRDAINKKWDEFSAYRITKATYTDKDGKEKVINFSTDLGLTLAGGVKGSVSITSSKAEVGLGAAVYINLDANAEQIANVGLKVLTSGLKVGLPDVQMQIGPVPVVFGITVVVGCNLEFSINPHICFVGLYGGEVDFGARYGINWKWGFIPIPYFNTFGSANKICETEAFIGLEGSSNPLQITWGPWVTVTPSIGIGWSALSIRASAPITASFKMTNELPTFKVISADLGLKAQFVPYFQINVLKIINIKKDFGTFDIVNGTLQLYPLPVKWK